MWQDFTDTQGAKPPYRINGNKGQRTNFNSSAWHIPSSNHPQTVNTAFCDGRVRMINESIRYTVWTQLMTPWGRQATASRNGVRRYTLNDSDIP